MDNVTHALAGMLVAELALAYPERRGAVPRGLRLSAYLISIFAQNVPDFDFVYTGITPGKLGYLLHHRGHTHTVLLGLLQGLLIYGLFVAIARWRRFEWAQRGRRMLLALALIGPQMHIALDFSNNYGVHPFWPLYNGWLYGDTLFIVEPLLWVTALPALLFLAERRASRVLLGLLFVSALVLVWVNPVLGRRPASFVTLVAAGALLGSARLGMKGRRYLGASAFAAVIVCFAGAGRLARAKIEGNLVERFTSFQRHDLVLAPMPGNPWCWSFLAVGVEGDALALYRGAASLWPAAMPASQCASRMLEQSTAPVEAGIGPRRADIDVNGRFTLALSEFRRVAARCDAAAFLRFARAPVYSERPAQPKVIGDLRYDRRPGIDFADLELPEPAVCPPHVPPWLPPRRELLE